MYKLSSSLRSRRDTLNRVSCASLLMLAGHAINANAQTVCYSNLAGPTSLSSNGTNLTGYTANSWLDDITFKANTGSNTYWKLTSMSVVFEKSTTNAVTSTFAPLFEFFQSLNTSATGATQVDNDYEETFEPTQNYTVSGNRGVVTETFNLTSLPGGGVYMPQTGGGVSMLIATNDTFASYSTTVWPVFRSNGNAFSGTVGSSANNFWQDISNTGNYQGSGGFYFTTSYYGAYAWSFTGTNVPAPSELAVMALGGAPLWGLLSRRRAKSSRKLAATALREGPPTDENLLSPSPPSPR